jgi:hypothetical protein
MRESLVPDHRGITNYAALLREIERWRWEFQQRVCFVTFNYDTMLEAAMKQVLHLNFGDLDRYIGSEYTLIKPHGSINWGREVELAASHAGGQQALINSAADLNISDRYRVVTDCPMLFYGSSAQVVFPALSIPVENKDEFSCPSEHVEALERILPQVSKVMTIGWRATEADFLGMLHSKLTGQPELIVISGDNKGVQETAHNLAAGRRFNLAVTISDGFTGLISDLDRLHVFLRPRPLS